VYYVSASKVSTRWPEFLWCYVLITRYTRNDLYRSGNTALVFVNPRHGMKLSG